MDILHELQVKRGWLCASTFVTRVSSNVNMKIMSAVGGQASWPLAAMNHWKVLFHNLLSCNNNLRISLLTVNCPTNVRKIPKSEHQIKKKKENFPVLTVQCFLEMRCQQDSPPFNKKIRIKLSRNLDVIVQIILFVTCFFLGDACVICVFS